LACEGEVEWTAAVERLRGAYADGPLEGCLYEGRRFAAWCAARGERAFPAAPESVAAIVEHYFQTCTVKTVETRLWHLRRIHRALGTPDPTRSEVVRLAFRRGARAFGTRRYPSKSRQATPVNAAMRDRLLACCPETLIGLRDKAILWLGYDTLCRQGELIALRVEDIECLADGTSRILLPASKCDPFGRGEHVYLTAEGLRHVLAWLQAASIVQGPILRSVHPRARRNRKGMVVDLVKLRLRKLAARAGLSAEQVRGLSGHSLRVGAAHDLAAAGRTLPEIMRAGRWRSLQSVALYVRDAPINVWAIRPDAAVREERAAMPGCAL
jgi:integrase